MSKKPIVPSPLGINYSNTFQSSPISDADAAAQINTASIKNVKLFNYKQIAFFSEAATNNITLYPAVPNIDLAALAAGTNTAAIVTALTPYAASLGAVFVGNEPLIGDDPSTYGQYLKQALENLHAGFKAAGIDVKLSVPFNSGIEKDTYPPSSGTFRSGVSSYVKDVCAFLKSTDSFFTINIYPFYSNNSNPTDVPLAYCLFTNTTAQFTDPASGLAYFNLFDAEYDATYFALKALSSTEGYEALEIVVGETGWPTAGAPNASNANAETYNQNLIAHIKSGNGTPKLPTAKLKTFVFEMYDEDIKSTAPGAFEVSWGWCAGSSKYKSKYTLNW